jgi:hypothetical protein
MRHAMIKRVLAVFAGCVLTLTTLATPPASASDGHARPAYPAGPPSKDRVLATTLTFKIPPSGSGSTTQQDVHCDVWFTPVPQYDFSGGYRRVHYGGQIICNTVGTLHIAVNLYEIVGVGEHQHRDFVDQYGPPDIVNTNHGGSDVVGCFAGTGKWQTTIFANWNGYPPVDYPAESSIYTLPCN